MTVANNYVPARYVGNGSTVSFAVDWRLESADDFVVYQSVDGVQTVVNPSEYTTVNTSTQHGVVFNTAPADGTIIVITRETPQEQDTPYKTSSGFQAEKVEEDFDSLTMMVQELQQDVDRAVKVDETETITPEELRDNLFTAAENATAAATAAQASAAAASVSEINAQASENTASAYATSASTSSRNAATSEENARVYSERAVAAKQTAETWATDAGTAATNAQRAAEDASSQATSAAASRASASQSATAAADDASTARQKAAEAAASATAADNSATVAQSNATTAYNAQTSATQSAYYAEESATAAALSASDARNAESLARSNATNASNSAATATEMYNLTRGYASTAETSSTNAAASATLAQQWAVKMDGTVDSTEYSAKYYAYLAAQSAGAAGANTDLSNLTATGEAKFTAKQDVLTAGDYIEIDANSVISVEASTDSGLIGISEDYYRWFEPSSPGSLPSLILVYSRENTLSVGNKVWIVWNNTPFDNFDTEEYIDYRYTITQTSVDAQTGNITITTTKDTNVGTDIGGTTTVLSTPYHCIYTSASDEVLPSQKAVKTYVDNEVSDLQTAINAKAADNAVVHLANAETITGVKTFSNEPIISKQNAFININNPEIKKGTNPSAVNYWTIGFMDDGAQTGGGRIGSIEAEVDTNGRTKALMRAYKYVANNWTSVDFTLYYPLSGDPYAELPETQPNGDDNRNLGTASKRWKQLYAGTTTISTSDEREKQDIEAIPDEVLDAWGEVEFYQFKYKDAIAEKGEENARLHTGLIAQRIESIFTAHGLDAHKYGLLCYDEWEADEEEQTPAGNRYALRYEECLTMEAAYQRRRADRIEARLAALEARA